MSSLKRLSNRAYIHTINEHEFMEIIEDLDNVNEENFESSPEYHNELKHFMMHKKKADLIRGDVICHTFYDYRNCGTLIYDGNNIIQLASELYEYGYLPNSFYAITEFPPKYWSDAIGCVRYIWLDLDDNSITEQIFIDNMIVCNNRYGFKIEYNGRKYVLCYGHNNCDGFKYTSGNLDTLDKQTICDKLFSNSVTFEYCDEDENIVLFADE